MNTYDGATCSCGSTWFKLVDDDRNGRSVAVTLDARGLVTGYTGRPVCIEWAEPWVSGRDRIRLVQ